MNRRWFLPTLGILLVLGAVAAAILIILAFQPPRHFRVAAGPADGTYFTTAQALKKALAAKGYQVEVLVTAGSLDNVALLQSGQADIGFLQGGTASLTDTTGLYTLANVEYEPMWVFYRTGSGGRTFNHITEMAGLRIGVGTPGSGTNGLAKTILGLAAINGTNTTFVEKGMTEMAQMLRQGDLDVAFFVTSARTPLIGELIGDPQLRLYAVQQVEALERQFPYLHKVTVYRGVFSWAKDIPPQDVPGIAARTALVARAGFHPDLIRLVLEELPGVLPLPLVGDPGEFPSLNDVEIPASPDAQEYIRDGPAPLEQILPFEMAAPLWRLYLVLLPLLVIVFPIWQGIKYVYTWYMNSQIVSWYPQILAIERQLPKYTLEQVDAKLALVHGLDDQISRKIRVSAGYIHSYYELRNDIRFVIGLLEQRREQLLQDEGTVAPDSVAN
jgi:TRAP transporter TAXI family solute receptor